MIISVLLYHESALCFLHSQLVTAIEAEERSPEYQFELDFTEEKAFQYVIDARRMGSVSHFINHSVRRGAPWNTVGHEQYYLSSRQNMHSCTM